MATYFVSARHNDVTIFADRFAAPSPAEARRVAFFAMLKARETARAHNLPLLDAPINDYVWHCRKVR